MPCARASSGGFAQRRFSMPLHRFLQSPCAIVCAYVCSARCDQVLLTLCAARQSLSSSMQVSLVVFVVWWLRAWNLSVGRF